MVGIVCSRSDRTKVCKAANSLAGKACIGLSYRCRNCMSVGLELVVGVAAQ